MHQACGPVTHGRGHRGASRDLLAMVLGRPVTSPLRTTGDRAVEQFQLSFPGP